MRMSFRRISIVISAFTSPIFKSAIFPRLDSTALRTPTLTIHGTLDRNAPYGGGREWARTLPDSRLITVAGGAHNVWIDDPTVVRAVDEFLDGKWPARAERLAP